MIRIRVNNSPSTADTLRIPLITTLHVIVVAVSVWLAMKFWKIAEDTLRGVPPEIPRWYRGLLSREGLAGLSAAAILALFSAGYIYAEPPLAPGVFPHSWRWRTAAPKVLNFLGWSAFGELSREELSRKPDGWDGKDLNVVKGAQLQDRSLRNIRAQGAFGVKADFTHADLTNADFSFADLRGADFLGALLENTDFFGADLRRANLSGAVLVHADLNFANIEGAKLESSSITTRQIRSAHNWFLAAHLNGEQLLALGVCNSPVAALCELNVRGEPRHEDRLRKKDFSSLPLNQFGVFNKPDFSEANLQHATLPGNLDGADLSKADLRNAIFNGTDLTFANLTSADLRGANLRSVQGLTRRQIESALIDEKTLGQLPTYLEIQKPLTPKN